MKAEKISHKTQTVKLTLNNIDQCIDLDITTLNGLWNRKQWEKELIDPNRVCLGIIQDSELIGICCGWIILDHINITFFAIHPSKHRKGFGEKLLHNFMSFSKNINVKTISLETKEGNYSAQALFKKLKFKEVSRRQKLYKDGSNAIIFNLNLSTES